MRDAMMTLMRIVADTPPVSGPHLQFGADACSETVVSWHTLQPVRHPRVLLGSLDGRLEQTVAAGEVSYTDAKKGQTVYAYHSRVNGSPPIPTISMRRCMMAPRRNLGGFARPRASERRSRLPALATKARQRSARNSLRPQE
jgi:hypothetical protein